MGIKKVLVMEATYGCVTESCLFALGYVTIMSDHGKLGARGVEGLQTCLAQVLESKSASL